MPDDKPQKKKLSFFDKPFEDQAEEIMKMETVDLKLLQALIGTRLPIGLSLYCSNFFLSRIVISQAKYQAYSALLNVLQDYQKPEREIFIDGIKESISRQINGNEDRLRQNALLPSSSSNLKSLTDSSCSDIKSYVQETDISNLCTFSVRKVIEIYHNYLSCEEVQNLESVLLKAKEIDDKYSYIESKKESYHAKREKALKSTNSNESLLFEIKDRTFFDHWYESLLRKILCEAEEDKKHILHGEIIEKGFFIEEKINSARIKLGSSFNKEVIKRVISKLLGEILSDSPVIKESLLSSMKCIDIDSYKGRMNYEAVNHKIISRANELILSHDTISQANMSDSIEERGLQYIVSNMHVSLLPIVEQEILNEMAKKAASHRGKDNKKRNLELLVICNGGAFQNALSLPSNLGFSEIERLYKDMLSIAFIEPGGYESCTLYDRLPLLELEEIKEAFPISITDDILKDIEKSLNKYIKVVEEIKQKIVDRVFGKQENVNKLYDLEQELEFSFVQKFLHPICYEKYQEVKKFVECKSFVHDNINNQKDSSFRGKFEEQLSKLDKSKREELGRLLLSSIDNKFREVTNHLLSCKEELKNKKKKLEEKSSLVRLLHPFYWTSDTEEKSFEICKNALQKSVATGDDELFYQALEDIKKRSKYMRVFQVNGTLFSKIYKTQHDSYKRMLSFRELAEGFIDKRKKYIAVKQIEYEKRAEEKATEGQHQVNIELAGKSMDDQVKINDLTIKSETFERRAEKAEVKLGETEVKLGETEAKAEEAEAEKKAVIIVMEEAERREIFLKDAKKFFIEQFKLVILYENLKNKFQNLSHEYINLRRELGEDIANNKVSNMKRIFDKMSGLATKLNKLDKRFNQKKQEEERCIQQSFSNENIEKFRCDVLQKVMQTREELECGIGVVEEEKLKVEQMIMDQQRIENIPDSNMSEAEAQSHQNTISKIA